MQATKMVISKLLLICMFFTFSVNLVAFNFVTFAGNVGKINYDNAATYKDSVQKTEANNIANETYKISSSIFEALQKALNKIDAQKNKVLNLLCLFNDKVILNNGNIVFDNLTKRLVIIFEESVFYCKNFDLKMIVAKVYTNFWDKIAVHSKKYRYIIGNGDYKRDINSIFRIIFFDKSKNEFVNAKMLMNSFLF